MIRIYLFAQSIHGRFRGRGAEDRCCIHKKSVNQQSGAKKKRMSKRASLPSIKQIVCKKGNRIMSKRTFQPSTIKRARTHGFLVRMKTRTGQEVIKRRRAKGRKQLAA